MLLSCHTSTDPATMQTQTVYLAAALSNMRAANRPAVAVPSAAPLVRIRATFATTRSGGYVTWAEGTTHSDAVHAAYLNILDAGASGYPGPWTLCAAVVLPEGR